MKSEGKPGNGSLKPDGARTQAALLSLENCIVVVIRINFRRNPKGKADGLDLPEGSNPVYVRRQVCRIPPGSKNGACDHRGNTGTWESQLSPRLKCRIIRLTG